MWFGASQTYHLFFIAYLHPMCAFFCIQLYDSPIYYSMRVCLYMIYEERASYSLSKEWEMKQFYKFWLSFAVLVDLNQRLL